MSAFDLESIFADQVRVALTETIDRLTAEVGRSLRTIELAPNITVTAPKVLIPPFPSIPAPVVNVAAPNVEVETGSEEICSHLATIEELLLRLIEMNSRPTIREVTNRDSEGRIVTIEDRR